MPIRLVLAALIAFVTFAPSGHAADPDALWNIISQKCLPNEQQHGQPAPCAVVDVKNGGAAKGYVVLKDREGDTQYLVMPTAKITGMEDPAILAPGAPNYFADAWLQRQFTIDAAKVALPREALSLAINSAFGRSQNQLHIHIDCVRADVRDAVQRQLASIGDNWAPLAEPLAGHPYRAMRVAGENLGDNNPFFLLANSIAKTAMGRHTLVVLGVTLPGGGPGVVILTDELNAATGDRASGEELQDHNCALAHP